MATEDTSASPAARATVAPRVDLNDFYSTASGVTFRNLVMMAGAAFTTYKLAAPDAAVASIQDVILAAGPVLTALVWGLRQVYQQTKLKIAAAGAEQGTPADEIKRRAEAITWREILLGAVDEGLALVQQVKELERKAALLEARADDLVSNYLEALGRIDALEKRVMAAGAAPAAGAGDHG